MNDDNKTRLTRRGFLAATVASALAACSDSPGDTSPTNPVITDPPTTPATSAPTSVPPPTTAPPTSTAPTTEAATTTVAPAVTSNPFTLGVASGDPLADSVILWTRLHPEGALPDHDIEIEWEVSLDKGFKQTVADGTATASAALAHSVHVDVAGLEPGTRYFYRFKLDGFETPPATTQTFVPKGTTPDIFTFAFGSCQNWEHGYYAAYRDLVERDNIDAFVFLGDYIYEYKTGGYADPRGRITGQEFECETLEQYRARYALYKTDGLLQQAHSMVPWIITWDDHEVDNDYARASSEHDDDADVFLARRAAAYQAWYEHMPVRLNPPQGPDYEIYRSFSYGDLLTFHVLDARQYRADQQRGEPVVETLGDAVQIRDEGLATSEDQSMLGADQRQWLLDGLAESDAVWDVLAQQVFMFGANAVADADPPIVVVDTWDGYAGERETILEAASETVDNLVVLTGDFHSAAVANLRTDPFDRELPTVGVELMATSISSSFFDADEDVENLVSAAIVANPQIKWFDTRRGYTHCEVTPGRWIATFRAVADQFDEASPIETASRWSISAGDGFVEQM